MEEANKLFNGIANNGQDFNKVKLGKVVKFNAEEMKAEIQPLPSEDNSLLINVPVMTFQTGSFFIRLPLKAGDVVIVLFADSDLDNILLGGDSEATTRKHDLSDSVCIGGVTLFTEKLTSKHKDDLVIANKDLSSKVVLKENGDLIIEGKNVFLGEGAEEGIPLGNKLKSWLDGHTHPYTWRDSAGNGVSSPPDSSSPNPSEVVKVK